MLGESHDEGFVPRATGTRSGFWFWTILSVVFLLYSYYFSVQAPLGWWPNYLLGHEMWLDNDPGGWYLPSAHQVFATRGQMVFPGHPGLPMQVVLHVQQKLYYWIAGTGSGLSFTEFSARHVPALALGARMIATLTHLLSFYALFVFSHSVTGKLRAAYISVLAYATSLPVLYYISRISVEPWMILFYLCSFVFFWKFERSMRSESRRFPYLWLSLASFSAVSGAFTKLHLLGPLPVFVFCMVLFSVFRAARSGTVTRRAGSAFVATYLVSGLLSFLAYSAVMDWSGFFNMWDEFLPKTDHTYASVEGFINKALDVLVMLWNSLFEFSWSRLLPTGTGRNLYFYLEFYFLCLSAIGIVFLLSKGPRGKSLAIWALLYSPFPVFMWIYRYQFHYLFTVTTTLAVFLGYLMSEVVARFRLRTLGSAEWSMILAAVCLLHFNSLTAVVESRIGDLETAKLQHSDVVAESLALLGPGARLGVLGDVNPRFHGLSASYARGVRSTLMEEVRRLYVKLPETFDPLSLDQANFVKSYGKVSLILDLRVGDPRPVRAGNWTPPADGVLAREPAAAQPARSRILVAGRELVDADGHHWRANEKVAFQRESVILRPGGTLFHDLPANELTGDRFLLQAEARSVDERRGVLRLQAVWLPEGGWGATDSAGQPLQDIQAGRAYTGGAARSHLHEITRPEMAARVAMFLTNDGDLPIEVFQVRLVAIDE